MSEAVALEIAQAAAPWVLEHGLDYAGAKRKARQALGLPDRSALPSNTQLEDAMAEHIALYLADSQPQELRAMRELAVQWMQRLAEFQPYLSGAVWSGLATQHQTICLQLFADDPKMVDVWLLNAHINFELHERTGVAGVTVPALLLQVRSVALGCDLPLLLLVHDRDDIKRAKRADERGKPLRGDTQALQRLLAASDATDLASA
jgi:hypothetical protein